MNLIKYAQAIMAWRRGEATAFEAWQALLGIMSEITSLLGPKPVARPGFSGAAPCESLTEDEMFARLENLATTDRVLVMADAAEAASIWLPLLLALGERLVPLILKFLK